MSYDTPDNDARLATQPMASGIQEYLLRLNELGGLEQDTGLDGNPGLKAVVEAVHTVLAGGQVEVKIVSRGNPDIYAELNRRIVSARAEAIEMNKKAGFYISLMP